MYKDYTILQIQPMSLLTNLFPPCQDSGDLIWTYTDKPSVFAKFTQLGLKEALKADEVVNVVEVVNAVNAVEVVNVVNTVNTVCAAETVKTADTINTSKPAVHTVSKLVKRQTPMQIIIQLSENDAINTDYMKSSLIDFISKKEFQKVFGVKKTAEVMKGITENKWNKSLVLFLSFIYDTAFVYLNKDVLYNSEKIYDNKITI